MKLLKKFLCGILSAVMLISSAAISSFAADDIKVKLNGTELSFDVPPQLIENRTMVPLRMIFEAMGATVEWDGETQTVTACKNNERVIATVNSKNVYINGNTKILDVPPQIIDNRTLVPIRFVAESFGANVLWDEATRTVLIATKWDGTGQIPVYKNFPAVPDFGAITGVPSKNNLSYSLDMLEKSDLNYYLDIMSDLGFRVSATKNLATCQNDNYFVDIIIMSDEILVSVTEKK